MTAPNVQVLASAVPPLHMMSMGASLVDLQIPVASPNDDAPTSREQSVEPFVDHPSHEEVRAALARILASTTFRHSARHRAFLRYVVDNTLAGRARAVKEVVIGLDVFGRKLDGFDPRRDSIVRVEARRLRKKIGSYYDGEGRRDDVEIRLAVGGYVPSFHFRPRGAAKRVVMPLVLVLPFIATDDGEAGAVAAGLCDQLTDGLGAIGGVRVMTTFAASRRRPVVDGWDKLVVPDGLDYVVDGSMTHLGSRWRCIAHLTSMSDGLRRWSRSFDFGPVEGTADGIDTNVGVDLFALQDRITGALCAAMQSELRRSD